MNRRITRRDFLKLSLLAVAVPGRPGALAVHQAPSERVFLDVPRYWQEASLSCEMAALRMAAAFHGVEKTEAELIRIQPTNRGQPRLDGDRVIWFDPNQVFPGNIRGIQLYLDGLHAHPKRAKRGGWGYGVYAPPIARVARRVGLQARVFDEVDFVYRSLEQGRVPIAIVPWGGRTTTARWRWFTSNGDPIEVMNAQHAVAVVGYNDDKVWVHDPVRRVSVYERGAFEAAFGLLKSGVAIGPPQGPGTRRA